MSDPFFPSMTPWYVLSECAERGATHIELEGVMCGFGPEERQPLRCSRTPGESSKKGFP